MISELLSATNHHHQQNTLACFPREFVFYCRSNAVMPASRDLPGFYYDSEKNRYFPLTSRAGLEQKKLQYVQNMPGESKDELRASSNIRPKVPHILYEREIGAKQRFGSCCTFNCFRREYLETQAAKPQIWSYGDRSGSAEGAVEEFYAGIQTCEGLKWANVLAWSDNSGFLTISEVMPFNTDVGRSTLLIPQLMFPTSQSSLSPVVKLPNLLPSKRAKIAESRVTTMRRLKNAANMNHGTMILTTLGSAYLGGAIYLLKQGQHDDFNWSNGQYLPLDIFNCAVVDCSVWCAAYCSATVATLGTSNGAVLVHLETSRKTRLIYSKSDVLSQDCDATGNLIFCGFRNGYISMVDVRSPSNPKRMPAVQIRKKASSSYGGRDRKSQKKINKMHHVHEKDVITQNFSESMRMNSAICSLVLLHSNDTYLLSSSMNGDIALWDRRSEKGPVLTYEGNHNTHTMLSLGVDASESLLLSGGENCTILIWSLQSGHLLQRISGLPRIVNGFSSPIESEYNVKHCMNGSSRGSWQMWLGSSAGLMCMHGASSPCT